MNQAPNLFFNENTETLAETEEKIKEYLKAQLPEAVYERWIEPLVLEKITAKEVVFGFYSREPLADFNRNYKQMVWIHISSVLGSPKKLKVEKRKIRAPRAYAAGKIRSRFVVAMLFILSTALVLAAAGVAVVGGSYLSNRNFSETFYSVYSLHAAGKVRIMQISDLHDSVYGNGQAQLLDRVEKLKPDLIVLTGDCLDSDAADTAPTVEFCAALADVAPTFYVYGNNEVERIYGMALTQKALDEKFDVKDDESRDPALLLSLEDEFEAELEEAGVTVLKNEMATVTVGETQVDVFGVLTSNPSAFWSWGGEAFDRYIYENTEHVKVTAIHEPAVFSTYSPDSWGSLMLAGHTHGGTARLPVLGPAYTHEDGILPQRKGAYVYGRADVPGGPLIVSSGLDNSNPLRVNNPPEIVIVDINTF